MRVKSGLLRQRFELHPGLQPSRHGVQPQATGQSGGQGQGAEVHGEMSWQGEAARGGGLFRNAPMRA